MRGERERERGVSGREWSDISPGPGRAVSVITTEEIFLYLISSY